MKKILVSMLALFAIATTVGATNEGTWSVKLESYGEAKLAVIKVVQTELGLGLKEAKDLVESAPCVLLKNTTQEKAEDFAQKLREAGATVTLLHNGIEVALDDDGSLWSVWLDEVGSQKLEVVKVVKEELGLGLKEAKDLVDSAPCMLLENVKKEKAEDLAQKLRAIGATVTVLMDINATNFPDTNFRNYVSGTTINKDGNSYLSDEEIAAVKEIDVNNKQIADLTGIEHFTALENLYCQGNPLKSLDVSKNTKLKGLYSFYNELTELDVSKNINLTNLTCYRNQISGDKMQALVENLPKVASGNFSVFKLDDEKEKNVITKSQVVLAKSKGWKVWACKQIGGYEYEWYEYEGSEDTPNSIEVNNRETITNNDWYSIDGKKLSGEPTRKGVYIINGKKVVK